MNEKTYLTKFREQRQPKHQLVFELPSPANDLLKPLSSAHIMREMTVHTDSIIVSYFYGAMMCHDVRQLGFNRLTGRTGRNNIDDERMN